MPAHTDDFKDNYEKVLEKIELLLNDSKDKDILNAIKLNIDQIYSWLPED